MCLSSLFIVVTDGSKEVSGVFIKLLMFFISNYKVLFLFILWKAHTHPQWPMIIVMPISHPQPLLYLPKTSSSQHHAPFSFFSSSLISTANVNIGMGTSSAAQETFQQLYPQRNCTHNEQSLLFIPTGTINCQLFLETTYARILFGLILYRSYKVTSLSPCYCEE